MTLSLRYGLRSDVGHVREGNEDSGYAGGRLVAVADGMGGAAAGEVASRIVITHLADLDEDVAGPDVLGALAGSIQEANGELRDLVRTHPALAGMGTTVTALLVAGQRLGLVHVGDSRCYLSRGGELTLVTRDHTLVQELVEAGEISADEAAVHPKRSLLLRALDGRGDIELDLSVREARVGDRYLLCSDGLSAVVSNETIGESLQLPEPQQAADRLVDLALRGGGPDNVTVVVADVVDGNDEGGPPVLVGAAADEEESGEDPDEAGTAAGRAARMQRTARGLGLRRREQPQPGAEPRRRRWLAPVIVGLLVLGLVLAGIGGWLYTRTQYYVGVSHDRVVIFRGVSGSIGPLHLSDVEQRGILVSDLAPESRSQVEQHINADSLSDARQILNRLEAQSPTLGNSTAPGSSPATPTATPTRTTTPQPTTVTPPASATP